MYLAEQVAWQRLVLALPPKGLAATVRAVEVTESLVRQALADPALILKPLDQCPVDLKLSQVWVDDSEWHTIAAGLHEHGLVRGLALSEVATVHGRPVLNGMFGLKQAGAVGPIPLSGSL